MLARNDTSNDVPNPLEVGNVLSGVNVENGSAAGDYQLRGIRGRRDGGYEDFHEDKLSEDPAEQKLYYWREDIMLHVFHELFHKIWGWGRKHERPFEQFWYTHQQMMRRYELERHSVGVDPVVPLTVEHLKKPLGPQYRAGKYTIPRIATGRKKDCRLISGRSRTFIGELESFVKDFKNGRSTTESNKFGSSLNDLHGSGHMNIAEDCKAGREADSVMAASPFSARDPIFWRWHTYLEDIMNEFRNKKNRYRQSDFDLHRDVEVTSVNTILDNRIKDVLITHWENKRIDHHAGFPITYKRLTHEDFKYKIQLKNPRRETRKVYVRLWLGLLGTENDISKPHRERMIEMDQFPVKLTGEEIQDVVRNSIKSAVTMEGIGTTTIKKRMDELQKHKPHRGKESWCGFPHHLLVPRSKNYNPAEESLGGQNYVLYAFVTTTDDWVNAGTTVNHMLCGVKNGANTKIDKKPFGFPFDKGFDGNFQLSNEHKFMASTIVKIIFSPEENQIKEIKDKASKLNGNTDKANKLNDNTGMRETSDIKCYSQPRTDNAKLLCADGETSYTWDGCINRGSHRIQCGKFHYPCNELKNEKEFLCETDCSNLGGNRVCTLGSSPPKKPTPRTQPIPRRTTPRTPPWGPTPTTQRISRRPWFPPRDPRFHPRDPRFPSRDPRFPSRDPRFPPRDPRFQRDPRFRGPRHPSQRDPRFRGPRHPSQRDPGFSRHRHPFHPFG